MSTLDLYKKRRYTTITIGEGDVCKIPNEYTVEEVERLFELQVKRDELEIQEAGATNEQRDEQMRKFWGLVFDQLEVMFQHYQPELTADILRKKITQSEALEMLGWFDQHRQKVAAKEADQKKNLS